MLNFYLLGVALAGLVVMFEFYKKDLMVEMWENHPNPTQFEMFVGISIGVAVLMALSWVLVVIKGHQYLMEIFD